MPLSELQKRQLKKRVHHLQPIVILGQHGLTESVVAEIDRALLDHELIKVRVNAADKDERGSLTKQICQTLNAELIQSIGHIIAIYRFSDKLQKQGNSHIL